MQRRGQEDLGRPEGEAGEGDMQQGGTEGDMRQRGRQGGRFGRGVGSEGRREMQEGGEKGLGGFRKGQSSQGFFEFNQESLFQAPRQAKKTDIVIPTLDLDLEEDVDLSPQFEALIAAAAKVAKLKTTSLSKIKNNAVAIAQNAESLCTLAEVTECQDVLDDFSEVLSSRKLKAKELKQELKDFAEAVFDAYRDAAEENGEE